MMSQAELLEALEDVVEAEGVGKGAVPSWLSPELAGVLAAAVEVRTQKRDRPRALQYLSGLLTDLFVDWHRLHSGTDVRPRIPELHSFLASDYSLDGLTRRFF